MEFSAEREGRTALQNAVKLATSLLLTWGVALVITFKLPRYLGPQALGWYRFGFEFAAMLAVFLHFGVDTYISREIPVRPKHASDFFGGVLALRALLLIPLFAYGWWYLQPNLPEERTAAAIFGLSQIFIVMNLTFQQILQAASTVGRLAIANVVAKLLWGGGTLAAVLLKAPFWVLPLPMLVAEGMKAGFLYLATRESIGLELRFDFKETKEVLRTSFPFFIAIAAVYLGASVDVVLLRRLVPADSEEVGWYSAAREIARLSAMMMPVLTGVLVPMMSRAMHNDENEFYRLVRRGMEGVCVVSMPLTLLLALSARFAIGFVLKQAFEPAHYSLEWLAPTFVLAYVNSLLWLALMIMKRSWTITVVSIVGTLMLPAFILVATHVTRGTGDGKMGMGVAMALSARELVLAVVYVVLVGKRALDARATGAIVKSLGICGAVVAAHIAMTSLGDVRLVLDALLYGVLALALRVIRIGDALNLLRLIKNRKQLQTS